MYMYLEIDEIVHDVDYRDILFEHLRMSSFAICRVRFQLRDNLEREQTNLRAALAYRGFNASVYLEPEKKSLLIVNRYRGPQRTS